MTETVKRWPTKLTPPDWHLGTGVELGEEKKIRFVWTKTWQVVTGLALAMAEHIKFNIALYIAGLTRGCKRLPCLHIVSTELWDLFFGRKAQDSGWYLSTRAASCVFVFKLMKWLLQTFHGGRSQHMLCSFLKCLLEWCEAVWGSAMALHRGVIGKPPTNVKLSNLMRLIYCLVTIDTWKE